MNKNQITLTLTHICLDSLVCLPDLIQSHVRFLSEQNTKLMKNSECERLYEFSFKTEKAAAGGLRPWSGLQYNNIIT